MAKHKKENMHMGKEHDGHYMHKHGGPESMSGRGDMQGDMSPTVENYQKPMKAFSQEGFSKTTQYIERQDRIQEDMARDIEKQAYKGRYS